MDRHTLDCDILVAGGGIAGVCTAVSAARYGAKVILCQDRSVLGGNGSSEIRMHICGADFSGQRGHLLQCEAREGGLVEEIRLENAVRNPQKSFSMMDLILYEKCRAEKNLTLLLDTAVTDAEVEDGRIRTAYANRETTEERFIIKAKVYVDCTGDGRLGYEAGAEFARGREGRDEYNESMAPAAGDEKVLGASILFQAEDMGRKVPFAAPEWVRKFSEEDLAYRPHGHFNYGYWWLEYGGEIDTIKDNDVIRDELLRIALGVWDHIKNSGNHDADNYALTWLGFVPGRRESRRFKGLYTFTQNDALESPFFEDTIAFGGWPLDVHPPRGIDAKGHAACEQPLPPNLYGIPLRCCVSRNISNLMFAGRNVSASHIGFSSLRVMATCGAVGQGVGAAAAESAMSGMPLSGLTESAESVGKVQDWLIDNDCFLPGVEFKGEDIAGKAEVRTSSESADGAAVNVLDKCTRSVHGTGGVRSEMVKRAGTNRWISAEDGSLPAWIELSWPEKVELREIRLVFDTGMHRPLTLSVDESHKPFRENMVWAAQPETVRDYVISYSDDEGWKQLAEVKGNYQRLNVHRFETVRTDKVKVTVNATNGAEQARICGIIL